jgi:hypothetical protein
MYNTMGSHGGAHDDTLNVHTQKSSPFHVPKRALKGPKRGYLGYMRYLTLSQNTPIINKERELGGINALSLN